jgi:lysophospholipase L1-like esterase
MTLQHSPTHLSIIALGDCNTSGIAGGEAYSVPGCLKGLLEQKGFTIKLTNLGRAMSTTREGVALANDNRTKADILLLNYGLVDAWITTLPKIYISYYPDSKLKKAGRKLLKSVKKRLRPMAKSRLLPVGHVVPISEFAKNLELIIARLKDQNPALEVILWGAAPTQHDPERNRHLRNYDAVLAELSVPGQYIDTRKLLEHTDPGEMYQDEVHLSRSGSMRVAQAMAECTTTIIAQQDRATPPAPVQG